jgi:hypothetical protein
MVKSAAKFLSAEFCGAEAARVLRKEAVRADGAKAAKPTAFQTRRPCARRKEKRAKRQKPTINVGFC